MLEIFKNAKIYNMNTFCTLIVFIIEQIYIESDFEYYAAP